MKLSILDQVPVPAGVKVKDAFEASVQLAKSAEKLGYSRYWVAEHHDFIGLACPNPDTLLTLVGTQTNKINLGAGAVLLPHYSPFKIAETYNLLSVLFPERIDLGLGRAPGGSAEVSIALSGNYLENVRDYPESIRTLNRFIKNQTHDNSLYNKIKAAPLPNKQPNLWMLGTSEKSAELAVSEKLNYVFGHFMSDLQGTEIISRYKETFNQTYKQTPKTMIAVSVICAETTKEAKKIARSTALWTSFNEKPVYSQIPSYEEAERFKGTQEQEAKIKKTMSKMIVGNPQSVIQQLNELCELYQTDELMLVTNTYEYADRIKSFKLIAKEGQLI